MYVMEIEKYELHIFSSIYSYKFIFFYCLFCIFQVVFKKLYSADSGQDLGTMKSLQDRIQRTNVKLPVKDHYDHDKDFAISFVDAYIVEAILDYFGMDDINSNPKRNFLPEMDDWDGKKEWFKKHFISIVDSYVLPHASESMASSESQGIPVTIILLSMLNETP